MYRLFFTIVAVILALATLCVCVFNPKMHGRTFVYDSDYQVSVSDVKTFDTKNIPAKVNNTKSTKQVKKQDMKLVDTNNFKAADVSIKQVPIKAVDKGVNIKNTKVKTVPQNVQKTQPKVVQQPKQVQEQEAEVVLWNKWRSNLQNQIMKDVKLPDVPYGTIFRFAFEVDKYGKVTNLQTWSDQPQYTPYAIQYIAPVIKSYQGRDILVFPNGSNRITTNVSGAWKIADSTKYSSPEDYKDIEKIRN